MLILTRKPDQSILIDGDITITVLSVDGDRVKLGIRAPAHISVLREEVRRAVGGENRRAAEQAPSRQDVMSALKERRTPAPPPPSSPAPVEKEDL